MTKQTDTLCGWSILLKRPMEYGPLFYIPQVGYTLCGTSGIQLSSLFIHVLFFDYWCSILGLSIPQHR